jgi:hypothetical protein
MRRRPDERQGRAPWQFVVLSCERRASRIYYGYGATGAFAMRYAIVFFLAAIMLTGNLARAQTASEPSPPAENLAAARELVQAMKATDTLKALLPTIISNMKAAVVQNRPEIEKQYDALMPIFSDAANARLNELADQLAVVYARRFTLDELHQIKAFYQTPVGQKMITEQPAIARETMAIGQQLGRSIATDIQTRMLEQMRKNGNAN